MRQLTGFVAAAAAVVMVATSGAAPGFGASVAAADETGSGSKVVPMSSVLRRCDFSTAPYVPSSSTGSLYTVISQSGNTVTAEVHAQGVTPDIWYGVRFVQMPRPTLGCAGSDPGVAMTRLYSDGGGNGTATVSAPLMDGATGAWVSVEGPLGVAAQMVGEFWSSDYLASI